VVPGPARRGSGSAERGGPGDGCVAVGGQFQPLVMESLSKFDSDERAMETGNKCCPRVHKKKAKPQAGVCLPETTSWNPHLYQPPASRSLCI
jgi:hypothetical protein